MSDKNIIYNEMLDLAKSIVQQAKDNPKITQSIIGVSAILKSIAILSKHTKLIKTKGI